MIKLWLNDLGHRISSHDGWRLWSSTPNFNSQSSPIDYQHSPALRGQIGRRSTGNLRQILRLTSLDCGRRHPIEISTGEARSTGLPVLSLLTVVVKNNTLLVGLGLPSQVPSSMRNKSKGTVSSRTASSKSWKLLLSPQRRISLDLAREVSSPCA
jgi:hypothetical protein